MEAYADRSRILTHQSCPRRRYFEYEVPTSGDVNGVRPQRLDMNLLLGSAFHAGIECLLYYSMCHPANPMPDQEEIDNAVDYCLNGGKGWGGYWPQVKSIGLSLEPEEDASYVYYEQAALVEALVRAYAIFVLPQVLDRFQVVDVEREERADFSIPGFTLHFLARVDGILLDKATGEIFILSLKTAKEWGKREDDSARHDMQGLSETRVVEQRLAKWHEEVMSWKVEEVEPPIGPWPDANQIDWPRIEKECGVPRWFYERAIAGAPPTVSGVIMQYALKGRRENSPKGSGKYCFNNALIRPWKKADDLNFGGAYAIRYEFQDQMGGNHRLGKGWNRVNIWEDMGVKKWIDLVASTEIQGFGPGSAIAAQFILPIEYFRNTEDMDRWERQVVAQEKRVTEGRVIMKAVTGTPNFETRLDEEFPMHTRACDWPTKCSFQEVCFGPKAYLHDPLSSGLYTIRTANHPAEEKI